jgi:hypothetical protein
MKYAELWLQFEERFGGRVGMGVPGGNGIFYTRGRKTLLIPDEEGELIIELMEKSLLEGKDLPEERYKNNVFKPPKGVLY